MNLWNNLKYTHPLGIKLKIKLIPIYLFFILIKTIILTWTRVIGPHSSKLFTAQKQGINSI
jgi:hypothetical protein